MAGPVTTGAVRPRHGGWADDGAWGIEWQLSAVKKQMFFLIRVVLFLGYQVNVQQLYFFPDGEAMGFLLQITISYLGLCWCTCFFGG